MEKGVCSVASSWEPVEAVKQDGAQGPQTPVGTRTSGPRQTPNHQHVHPVPSSFPLPPLLLSPHPTSSLSFSALHPHPSPLPPQGNEDMA